MFSHFLNHFALSPMFSHFLNNFALSLMFSHFLNNFALSLMFSHFLNNIALSLIFSMILSFLSFSLAVQLCNWFWQWQESSFSFLLSSSDIKNWLMRRLNVTTGSKIYFNLSLTSIYFLNYILPAKVWTGQSKHWADLIKNAIL